MHSGRATGHIGEKWGFPQEKLSAWLRPWRGAAKGRQAVTRLCRPETGSSSLSRVQAAFLRLISPNLSKGYSAAHSNLGLNLRSIQKAGQASQVDGFSRVTMDKCIHYCECNVFSAQQGAEQTFGGWSGSALGALSSRAQHAVGT